MSIRKLLNITLRALSMFFGGFLVLQGVTTFGFLIIIQLFANQVVMPLYFLGLIFLSIGLVLAGLWFIFGGIRDFPYLRRLILELKRKMDQVRT